MSVRIFCLKKQILHLRNITFGSLYESITSLIEEKNLELNNGLDSFITTILYVGGYGVGCDISDYLKNKNDTLIFADLVKQAIEKEQKSEYPFREDVEKLLWDFHQAIVDYATQLKE